MAKERRGSRLKLRLGAGLMFIVIIITFITLSSLVIHISKLNTAKNNFDIPTVKQELDWFKKKASWMRYFPLIRDGEFWLKLNLGQTDSLEPELSRFQDDKHLFWLLQLKLQKNDIEGAKADLKKIKSTALTHLAEALLAVAQSKYEKAQEIINKMDAQSQKLSLNDQVLKDLTLSRTEMILGNQTAAKQALERAGKIAPNHPAVLRVNFDMALWSGDWKNAWEISRRLETLSWWSPDTLFLVQKGILALHIGENSAFEEVLEMLNELPGGSGYRSYLLGIRYLSRGDLVQGKAYLEIALKGGIVGQVKFDAEQALNQVQKRQSAQPALNIVLTRP